MSDQQELPYAGAAPFQAHLDLFEGPGAARADDPDTSWLAAMSRLDGKTTDRRLVLLVHDANPDGITDFELALITKRQQTSVGKRRGELRDVGLIEATEERRDSPSGSSAIVWRITALGRRLAKELGAA